MNANARTESRRNRSVHPPVDKPRQGARPSPHPFQQGGFGVGIAIGIEQNLQMSFGVDRKDPAAK
jgi:hypothetical protein